MKPEWQFSEQTGNGLIETDKKTATITRLKDGRWRWAIHDKVKKLFAKRDGWWGVNSTLEEAIKCVERQLIK